MTSLMHRRSDGASLRDVVEHGPTDPVTLAVTHRTSLAIRFRAVASTQRRRVDAWLVERSGEPTTGFAWTPSRARRAIGRGALARFRRFGHVTVREAIDEEIDELLVRAAAGYASRGSLADWIGRQPASVIGCTAAEATAWVVDALELLEPLDVSWTVCEADAYYDVAAARTTLRGQRDVIVTTPSGRTLIRFRRGLPTKSAGAGLRADLVIDGLSDVEGRLARRIVGLWPDAGILLAVDGTLEDARSGARDLVRTAVTLRRREHAQAA